ncbi:transmembrane protein [Heterostelium album PN500]|uniref:Transmembrane protein n=1 Tax=Heterostelium pallidum (strain ATCC 26659 / Pp 5 / PN500) TaxID=670386 RepID=D3BC28_HETP5|nr:transmembrane protein [Heterostelium album PN500]EFA81211.1 transmembrane protein [Heterostelium album PN500]|eukprot:XP_020433329.1 transmembrane protein [Heterostelium album PN500]
MDSIMSKNEKELLEIRKEIQEFEKSQSSIKEKGYSFKEQINAGFRHLDEICGTLDKQDKESSRLSARLSSLPKSAETAELTSQLQSLRSNIKQSKKTFTPETGGSLTNLLWPFSESFAHFLPQMTYISGVQGLVQILTNRYQQGQLYKLTAMGKATIMDVTGENMISDPGWTPNAFFLLPFLAFVQAFEVYNGVTFLVYAFNHEGIVEWQVIACGVGNFYTTCSTYYAKLSNRKEKEKEK